jgi:hypothetical protein
MKLVLLSVLASILAASSAFAMGCNLMLDDLMEADVIARVQVVAIADAQADLEYTKVARVRVTGVVKGAKVGDHIEIFSEPKIIACPFIVYEVGDDCIVALKRRPNGIFTTMNSTAGKFTVKNGKVAGYSFTRFRILQHSEAEARKEIQRTDFQNKSPNEFIADLRRVLSEIEKEGQSKTEKKK